MRDRIYPPRALFRWIALGVAGLTSLCVVGGAHSQEEKPAAVPAARAAVPLSFLPPPLEGATYSLGIYEAKTGKLIRHLHEIAPESAFAVGLNGLITKWDGEDDKGELAPPGRYAARGYAVGALKVEGTDVLGNDWAAGDEKLRVKHVEAIAYIPADDGVAVLASMADGSAVLLRFSGDGKLLWRQPVNGLTPGEQPWLQIANACIFVLPKQPSTGGGLVISAGVYQISDGGTSNLGAGTGTTVSKTAAPSDSASQKIVTRSFGKDDTLWTASGADGLVQTGQDGTVLRSLKVTPGDPLPTAVSASSKEDRLYLLEERAGWQRLRGLSWVETKNEDGKQISTWQTFFERNIRAPDPALGLETSGAPIEITLVENPLEPAKPQKVKLAAGFDEKGSYLTTSDGLRLRQISERAGLKKVKLAKGKPAADSLVFFDFDGAAWDEFSIAGARNMMSFDAGEFEMTATGEKRLTEQAPE